MKNAIRLVLVVAVLCVGLVAYADVPTRPTGPNPVDERIAALEKRVATLEQQNAELRRFVVISGDALALRTPNSGNLTLEAPRGNVRLATQAGNMSIEAAMGHIGVLAKMGDVNLEAQMGKVTAKGMTSVAIETNAALRVKAGADLSLLGARVVVNGGKRSVARTGDPAPGGIIGPASPTLLTD